MKPSLVRHRIAFLIAISAAMSSPAGTISWTNTSGGNWSVAANWNPNQVPGSSDDAVITASGTYTVTLDTSPTVNSLTLGGAFGRETLNTLGNNLTVNNPSTVNGNGILGLSGGTLSGSVSVDGTMSWSGGSLGYDCWLTVASNGVMDILGSVNLLGFLTNAGTVNWHAGDISVYCYGPWFDFHGEIWNEADAVWNIQCDQTLVGYGAVAPFYNAGLLKKTTSTSTTTLDVYLANSGEVHAESGTLWLEQGGALGGTFQADASAEIYFTGGSFTLNGQPNFEGPGLVHLVGGQITVNQSSGVLDIYGGDLIGNSSIRGTLNWHGDGLTVGATLTVTSNGVLNILGNIYVAGGLTNAGTVNWQGGDLILRYRGGITGEIWNEAEAVWNIQCDQTLVWEADLSTFHNAGLLEKTASTNTTSLYAYLDNSGEVHAESGTIQFLEGSNLGGTFQANAGAAIYLNGGSYNLDTPPNFQGPGLVQSANASLIGQNIIAGGTFNWESGQLASGASLTVGKDGVLNITGSVSVMGPLTNAGTVNWQSGAVQMFGASIWNEPASVWNIQCDQDIGGEYGNEQFYNAGLIEKTGGTNTTSFNLYVENSGFVHAESGTIQFNGGSDLGGSFQADASAAIYFVGGSYTFSRPPNFQGAGPVQLAGGFVTLNNFVGNLDLDGPSLAGQSTLAGGTLNWSSGLLANGASLTVATNGILDISGSISLEGALTNDGTVNWQAGDVTVFSAVGGYTGAIWNEAGGLWNIQCDQTLGLGDPWPSPFYNAGLVQKKGGTNTTSFNSYFQNSGGVQAESGTIQFNGGSDLGGTFQAGANAAIYVAGGTYTLSTVSNFYGPGPVQITGGSVTLANFVGTLDIDGATLAGQSILSDGTLNWNSGLLASGASLTVASNCALDITRSVSLAGALTNGGTVNWQSGDVSVVNAGPWNPWGFTDPGEIWNLAGGVWNIQCDQSLTGAGGSQFYNKGLIQKTAGTNTTGFYMHLQNSGAVRAETGTIQFYGGSDLGGTFQADASAAIYFGGGNYTLSNTISNFYGPGPVQITGGTVTLANFVGAFDLSGPDLAGQSTLSGGTLNWSGGTLLGGGLLGGGASLAVASNGVLNILGSVYVQGKLTNAGTVNWQAGDVSLYHGRWWGLTGTGEIWNEVGAVWKIQCDQTLLSPELDLPTFHNAGLLEKGASTNTTSFAVYLDNSGTIEADTGTISFQDGYADSSSANLLISLGGTAPGDDYGRISFSTPLAVSGTFTVGTRNGFSPTPGQSFQVLSYASATNNFDCLSGLDLGGGTLLQPEFRAGTLTLLAALYTTNASLPQLFISPALSEMAIIIWPVGFPGWTLQSATSLCWQASVPVSATCDNQALVPINTPQQCFRLKKSN